MNVYLSELINPKYVKIVAAIVIGLSVGSILPPDPAAFDILGVLPGTFVAGTGVIIGAIMYTKLPEIVSSKSCGCTGDCGCAD